MTHLDPRRGGTLAAVALLAVVFQLVGGCTSDEPNPVGATIPPELDLEDPVAVTVRTFAQSGSVTLTDDDVPFDESEVLYLGAEGGVESSILLTYDLSAFMDSLGVDVPVNASTVQETQLTFYRLNAYAPEDTLTPEIELNIEMWALADTLDTSLYPGPEPATSAFLFDEFGTSAVTFVDFHDYIFLDWLEDGRADIMIRAGAGSDPGLLGFASRDLQLNTAMPQEWAGTKVGVTLQVTVDDLDDDLEPVTVSLAPVKDVSTFHVLDEAGGDLSEPFMMRTHLRESPWFRFDLSSLPEDVLVNRAVVRCAVDTTGGYGPSESVVLSEVPLSVLAGVDTLAIQELEGVALGLGGNTNIDPAELLSDSAPWLGFNVTMAVQRHVNGVDETEMAFMLNAGEDMFSSWDQLLSDPEFYLTRFQFFGTGHLHLSPYLEVTYTVFSGGEQ